MRRLSLYWYYAIRSLYYLRKGDRITLLSVIIEASNKLGGIVVKLLQFLSFRTELFTDTEKMQLLSVFDQVENEPVDIHKVLAHDFSPAVLAQLTHIDTKPFAAGSFSQVFRARHQSGADVIIKIKRSNLSTKLWLDFLLLDILSLMFTLIYEQHLVNVRDTIAEFKRLTYQELDYRRELAYTNYFYQQYQHNPSVVTPQAYTELSNHRILTQTFIDGVPLTTVLRSRFDHELTWEEEYFAQGIDVSACMHILGMELLRQGAFFDYCYVDPHPGNIMVLPNNKIAFVDFGLVIPAPIDREHQLKIIRHVIPKVDDIDTRGLALELLAFGAPRLYRALKTLDGWNTIPEQSLLDAVTNIFQNEIDAHTNELRAVEKGETEHFSKQMLLLLGYGRSLNVRMPADFFGAFRAITLFNSYRKYISRDRHPIRGMYQQLMTEVDQRGMPTSVRSTKMSYESAVETIFSSLEYMAETRPTTFNSVVQSLNHTLYA